MKKIIKLILASLIVLPSLSFISINEANAVTENTINIKGLSDRKHLEKARVNRGDSHVREAIPYIIPAGTEVSMKQVSGTNVSNLPVQALNNDSATEASYTLNKDGSELKFTVAHESVLFIKVPRGDQDIEIEYNFSVDVIDVPYFFEGDSEAEFFSYWDSSDASFAIIENDDVQFLIPKADKDYLRDLAGKTTHANIDALLQYYTRIVTNYDYLLGLEDNAENPLHANADQQFFAKANASGAGLAYYSTNEMAMSAEKFGYRYLSVGWVEKHEIAHGYQQNGMMDIVEWPEHSINVREVWNNVFAHNIRTKEEWNGDNVYDSNRMSKSQLQYSANNDYAGGDYTQKLNFFVSMFDAFGYEGFRGFNREYREMVNLEPSRTEEYSNSQYMAWYFSQYSGVNFVKHFEQSGIEVEESIEDMPEIRDLSYAQFLNFVVLDDAKRAEITSTLGLQADYEMVDTSIIRDDRLSHLNLNGDVVVNLDIDDLDEIMFKKVILKNGEFEVEQEIFSNSVTFTDVPAGVYRVLAPTGENGKHLVEHSELITVNDDGSVTTNVTYTKNTETEIDNLSGTNVVFFNGLGDKNFATLETFTDRIRVRTKKIMPHSYITGEYASIKIYDENNVVVYEKSFIGNVTLPAETINIPSKPGYRVEMTFTEPNRSSAINSMSKLDIYPYANNFNIMMDEKGTYVNDKNILADTIDAFAAMCENSPQYYYHTQRVELTKSISRMDEEQKNEYLIKHKDVLQLKRPIFENVNDEYEFEAVLTKTTSADVIKDIIVSDFEDGDLTSKIEIIEDNVDFTTEGDYLMTLRVEDSDKNANYTDVKVKIVSANPTEPTDPVEPVDPTSPDEINNDNPNSEGGLSKTGLVNSGALLFVISLVVLVTKKRRY